VSSRLLRLERKRILGATTEPALGSHYLCLNNLVQKNGIKISNYLWQVTLSHLCMTPEGTFKPEQPALQAIDLLHRPGEITEHVRILLFSPIKLQKGRLHPQKHRKRARRQSESSKEVTTQITVQH
jgi:hypothetical protein